jgi:hypothetical protein
LTTLEEYYRTEASLNDNRISVDINFENRSIDENIFYAIKAFLENISQFDNANKPIIKSDFNKKGEAYEYINFYIEELSKNEISDIIGINNRNETTEEQLLNKLKLVRVGLYPDGKNDTDYFGVFDYSIDIYGKPCNQLLVVKTDVNGALDHITWES